MGGLQPRGLGESGSDDNDDEKEPSSPDFLNLCLEVGHWSPRPSPTEGPRGSPSIVESFLESLVEEQEFAFDESSESELPGAGDWHPMESPTDGPRASPIMVQSFFQNLEKQALADFGAALLAGPPEGESTPGLQVGVKRPASDNAEDEDDVPGPSGKVARTGSVTVSTSIASSHPATISSPSLLGGAGAEEATTHSDSAASSQGGDGDTAGSVFLRVPTLEASVKVKPFRSTVLQEANLPTTLPEGTSDANVIASGLEMWRLTKRLAAATDIYKEGGRPSNEEILYLMRKLFCFPGAPGKFRRKPWDAWRQDAGC
ncbi:hypothetical protein Efla_000995 [Eimeria flavescens]